MKNKAFLFILAFSILFTGIQFDALAGHHQSKSDAYCLKSKFFNKYDFIMENRAALEITDDQANALKNIKYTVKKAKIESKATGKMTVLDIYHEIYQGQGNLESLNGYVDEKLEAERKLGYALVKGLLDFKNVLSDSQNKKLKELWYDKKYAGKDHCADCCEKKCGHGDNRCHKN